MTLINYQVIRVSSLISTIQLIISNGQLVISTIQHNTDQGEGHYLLLNCSGIYISFHDYGSPLQSMTLKIGRHVALDNTNVCTKEFSATSLRSTAEIRI